MKDEMLRKDINILEHVRDYCKNIEEIHERFGNDINVFMEDKVYEQAIAFNVMQIGELVAKLSDSYKKETKSSIPWTAIKGMRNVVVHSYGHIDKEILWDSSVDDISTLKDFCSNEIENFDKRKSEDTQMRPLGLNQWQKKGR